MGAQKDPMKKLNDVLSASLKLTQKKTEDALREFIKMGEAQGEQIKRLIEELTHKSMANAESLAEAVRKEVLAQLKDHELLRVDELKKLVESIVDAVLSRREGSDKTKPDNDPNTSGSTSESATGVKDAPASQEDKGGPKRSPNRKPTARAASGNSRSSEKSTTTRNAKTPTPDPDSE